MTLMIKNKNPGLFFICIAAIACDPSSKSRNPQQNGEVDTSNLPGDLYDSSFKTREHQGLADPSIDNLARLDVSLPKPQPGDWLWTHKESGQSFSEYLNSKPVTATKIQNKFYLLPVGKFSKEQENIINYTADYLSIFFDRETIVLPPIKDSFIPESERRILSKENEQFKTGTILDYLQEHIPPDAIAIMAITSNDLYPSEAWNFVFGQARLKKRVGVSSLFRYCDPSVDSAQYGTCLKRMIKTSSHEMGHMLSFQHCTHAVCVMNGTNSLSESDSRPNRLCSVCLKKLQWNLGFNVKDRLRKMKDYFATHKLEEDHQLAVEDRNFLEQ